MSATTTVMKANLRKGKSQTVSLILFILIASAFCSIGLMMNSSFGKAYDQRSEALHAPHLALFESTSAYTQAHLDYVSSYAGVRETETLKVLFFAGDITFKGSTDTWSVILADAGSQSKMNGLTVIEGAAPKAGNDVCVPYIFKLSGGYKLGDTLKIAAGPTEISYKISGFTEELVFGTANVSPLRVYVTSQEYAQRAEANPDWETVVINARMDNPADADKLANTYNKKFFIDSRPEASDAWCGWATYSGAKAALTQMSTLSAVIIMIFSAVLGAVALLVIRFRIRNSIEESMTNLGALKATGYTGGQLVRATVVQFFLIAVVGVIAGIGASYALLPAISHVFEVSTALKAPVAFDPVSSITTLVVILATVTAVTWLSARHIRKLHPLTALKLGLATRSFKRNHLPLDRAHGPLAWLLAVKTALHSKGHAAMLLIIVVAVGFASGVGASMYDNLAAHPEDLAKLMMGEKSDVIASAKTPEEAADLRAFIEAQPNVRKTYFIGGGSVLYDDLLIYPTAVDDFGVFEGQWLYEGSYPGNGNEIAVTGDLGKKIGDSVKLSKYGTSQEYKVVGLIQGQIMALMTTQGYRNLDAESQQLTVFAYVKDTSKTADLVNAVNDHFGKDKVSCSDTNQLLKSTLAQIGGIFQAISFVILAITLLVVLMSVWLLMKTMILRRRQEFGIQKTIGYTTWQIMNQLGLYFTPLVAIGLVGGGILGALSFNPVFVALTASMGVHTANMPTPWGLTLLMCAVLILVAYVFSMIVAWRTRRISPVELVAE